MKTAILVLVLLAACGSNHVSKADAANTMAHGMCERFADCSPEPFVAAYPGGTAECAKSLTAKLDTSGESECTQSGIDACKADIAKLSCEAMSDIQKSAPTSCTSC